MAAILLDTTVLIDVLHGRPETVARLRGLRRQEDTPFTSAVNVEEVFRGLPSPEESVATRLLHGLLLAPSPSA